MDELQLEPISEAADRHQRAPSDDGAGRIRRLLLVGAGLFFGFVLLQAVFAGTSTSSVVEGERAGRQALEPSVDRPQARGLVPDAVPVQPIGQASYDGPVSKGVRVLTPPPLLPRVGSAMIANDDGIFVWGGHSELDGGFLAYNDGAFYHFETAAWTVLPQSPIVTNRGTRAPAAAWAGDEAIVFHNRQGAAWDPASNTWRSLQSAPGDVLGLYPLVGRGLYAVTNETQGFYQHRDDSWSPATDTALSGATLEGVPRKAIAWRPGVESVYITVPGDEIELWKEPGGERVALDRPVAADHVAAAWIRNEIVIATSDGLLLRYNIDTERWTETPIPMVFDGRAPFSVQRGIVIDEVARLADGSPMWQVLPPSVPGSSSAGSVLIDGDVWRLGTSVDTDGSTWAFTVVDGARFVRHRELMLGPNRLRIDQDVLLRMLAVPIPETTGETAADRYIRVELLVLPRLDVPGGVCELTYGTDHQAEPVPQTNRPSRAGTIGVNLGRDGHVLIECPSEASALNLADDLSVGSR